MGKWSGVRLPAGRRLYTAPRDLDQMTIGKAHHTLIDRKEIEMIKS